MSKELLKALTDVIDDLKLRAKLSEDGVLAISDSVLMRAENVIENYLAQPEQEPTNYMHEIFPHNLKNKEKLGEMIINLDDQYITLLGHKVVITEIIDREAYPVVGYFIDLNNDGEPRINETEWDKKGNSAYCLGWHWGLTLDTSPNPDQEVFTQPEPIEDKFDRVKSNREFYQAGYAEAERELKQKPLKLWI